MGRLLSKITQPRTLSMSKFLCVGVLSTTLFLPINSLAQFPDSIGVNSYINWQWQQRALARKQAIRRYLNYFHYRLEPVYMSRVYYDPEWQRAVFYIRAQFARLQLGPLQAENGDWLGLDNNDDGIPEPVYVETHVNDGELIEGHYRALPYSLP
jgi:hypothetical protein